MSQNKILFTLTGLLAAIYAINKVTEEKSLQENFFRCSIHIEGSTFT